MSDLERPQVEITARVVIQIAKNFDVSPWSLFPGHEDEAYTGRARWHAVGALKELYPEISIRRLLAWVGGGTLEPSGFSSAREQKWWRPELVIRVADRMRQRFGRDLWSDVP
jgi:hypothetical protein